MAFMTFIKKINVSVPARLQVGLMIFMACWITYMLRVNMSINIIAMVNTPKNHSESGGVCAPELGNISSSLTTETPHPDTEEAVQVSQGINDGTYEWDARIQGLILGSYFWGYVSTSLLAASAVSRWGPRFVVKCSVLLSAVATAASPAAADLHYGALIACRFFIGAMGGLLYPCLHALVARWSPPAERGKFASALMGGALGTVCTWALCGALVPVAGWRAAFYAPAALAATWCLLWHLVVADSPKKHPRISDEEARYIADCIGDNIRDDDDKSMPPYREILTSVPFLSMVVLHFGNLWGMYFVMTAGPTFVSTVLGFELQAAGALSGLPYLARMLAAVAFGACGDLIVRKGWMTTTMVRKSFTLFSHIIPGIMVCALSWVGCSRGLSVALITGAMGFNGAAAVTNLQNHQDLAPTHAATLYGIANFVGSTAGFLTPAITAHFTATGNGFEEWSKVFYIGASVYAITALFFIIFGSGKMQSWNHSTHQQDDENKNQIVKGHNKNKKEICFEPTDKYIQTVKY